uniref:C2H2-type domain-containing protein n=1 Tax=Heterorhabditis bacteriophora TaxID=37862 RepID=A0A1I7XAW6_HETBA
MSRVHSVHAVHTIALPAEVEIMCTNIFPTRSKPDPLIYSQPAMDCVHIVEDRGAKSGHGRSQRTDARMTHSAYRCFYCSSENKSMHILV